MSKQFESNPLDDGSLIAAAEAKNNAQTKLIARTLLQILAEGSLSDKQLLDRFFTEQGVYEISDNIERFRKQQALIKLFDNAVQSLIIQYAIRHWSSTYSLTRAGQKMLDQKK